MKKAVYFLVCAMLLSSCATILNRRQTYIDVYTTGPSRVIVDADTLQTNQNKASLVVDRSSKPVSIVVQTDSLSKTLTIPAGNSPAYYLNIPYNYGIGMLIDMNNPKRYRYPKRIYLSSSDSLPAYSRFGRGNHKGESYFHLSIPFINSFLMRPAHEPNAKVHTGFWGFSMGMDYYHSRNQYVSLTASGATDVFFFPLLEMIFGESEVMYSSFLALSNNHKFKRISAGYGLAYGINTWQRVYGLTLYSSSASIEPVLKEHQVMGFIFPCYYQLGDHMNLGIIYRPTMLRFDSKPTLAYEHLVSVDVAWKIRNLAWKTRGRR